MEDFEIQWCDDVFLKCFMKFNCFFNEKVNRKCRFAHKNSNLGAPY